MNRAKFEENRAKLEMNQAKREVQIKKILNRVSFEINWAR